MEMHERKPCYSKDAQDYGAQLTEDRAPVSSYTSSITAIDVSRNFSIDNLWPPIMVMQ